MKISYFKEVSHTANFSLEKYKIEKNLNDRILIKISVFLDFLFFMQIIFPKIRDGFSCLRNWQSLRMLKFRAKERRVEAGGLKEGFLFLKKLD